MDESSPYQSPASFSPPALPQGPPPQVVKIFGILHLVFAGLGIILGIWGFFSMKFTTMIQGMSPNDPSMVVQRKYAEDLWPVTVMNSTFLLGLAALLLVAGLKLVYSKPDGVMWSNRYAWTSITTKIISLVVVLTYVLPLSNRMMGEIVGNTRGLPAGAAGMMTGMIKSMTSIATIATPVISCVYPLLALYFLSRPAVKNWVANAR
ncbi:hypothetical protein OKA05_28810 [Luteolibacter arcticus]|uniref:DUF2269 family protein n=1 Tax=Luteolibacter arcticus TaxID=1581411 RepID=A0ABT3GSV6_9BACT|nr:hypothetical protein [Luteolibacter arcticus]MCW1926588.1 hypothetical protein [Luteolibacter arcticus]